MEVALARGMETSCSINAEEPKITQGFLDKLPTELLFMIVKRLDSLSKINLLMSCKLSYANLCDEGKGINKALDEDPDYRLEVLYKAFAPTLPVEHFLCSTCGKWHKGQTPGEHWNPQHKENAACAALQGLGPTWARVEDHADLPEPNVFSSVWPGYNHLFRVYERQSKMSNFGPFPLAYDESLSIVAASSMMRRWKYGPEAGKELKRYHGRQISGCNTIADFDYVVIDGNLVIKTGAQLVNMYPESNQHGKDLHALVSCTCIHAGQTLLPRLLNHLHEARDARAANDRRLVTQEPITLEVHSKCGYCFSETRLCVTDGVNAKITTWTQLGTCESALSRHWNLATTVCSDSERRPGFDWLTGSTLLSELFKDASRVATLATMKVDRVNAPTMHSSIRSTLRNFDQSHALRHRHY